MMFSFRAKFNHLPYIEDISIYLFFSVNVDIDSIICKCISVHIYCKIEDVNKTDVNTAVQSLCLTFPYVFRL